MDILRKTPKMVRESKKAKFLPNGVVQVIIALALIIISEFISSFVITFGFIFKQVLSRNTFDQDMIKEVIEKPIVMLFATTATIIVTVFYVLFIERRSAYSMGFGKKHILKDYIIGFGVGIIMFSTVVFTLYITNNLMFEGVTFNVFPIVLIFLIGFLIQGASEEVVLRGYLLNSLGAKYNLVIAVIINSSIFGILHLGNPSVSILSIVNIILFGIFASLYALKFNNIWGISALHSAWNFVQGNIYGLEVSGIKIDASILNFKARGHELLTGGSFGPEGGIITTVVLLVSTAVVLSLQLKRYDEIENVKNC